MDPRDRGGRFGDPRIRHFGAGESYRPDRRPSPPPSSYRRNPDDDSYVPPNDRRPDRPRSPPPPPRRRSRSPFRDRDAELSRDRFVRERSPQRFSRDRYPDEPPRSPPRRAKSPDRDTRYSGRRSPVPESQPRPLDPRSRAYEQDDRYPRDNYGASPRGRFDDYEHRRDPRAGPPSMTKESQTSSRRSSPPFHPSRAQLHSADHSRAPSTRPDHARSPPRAQPAYVDSRDNGWGAPSPAYDNRGEHSSRGGRDRDTRGGYQQAPAHVSMSAHNRPHNPPYSPGPPGSHRGGQGYRGPPGGQLPHHDNYNGRPPPPRNFSQSYPGPPPPHRQQQQNHYPAGPMQNKFDRSGPRLGPPHSPYPASHVPPGSSNGHGHGHAPPPFRSNNSSSKTYPLTQRFNLNTAIVPGGRLAPPSNTLSPEIRAKLKRLEADSEKLRRELEEKEAKKDRGMEEWRGLQREVASDGLKSEMAEESLDRMKAEEEDSAF